MNGTSCVLCDGESFRVVEPAVRDNRFGSPGSWRILACESCGLWQTDPVPTQAELEKACRAAITGDWISLVKVNSEEQLRLICDPKKGKLRLKTPCTIFIGGQILDRGITIDNLLAFYYGRSPKKFQQNTVMQHSRMYGPRPLEDLAVTRLYTTNRVPQAMRQMHARDK
ncbi:MAG: Z1 domain-containing protein, partial [Alphaproteobacteria bacterium]